MDHMNYTGIKSLPLHSFWLKICGWVFLCAPIFLIYVQDSEKKIWSQNNPFPFQAVIQERYDHDFSAWSWKLLVAKISGDIDSLELLG